MGNTHNKPCQRGDKVERKLLRNSTWSAQQFGPLTSQVPAGAAGAALLLLLLLLSASGNCHQMLYLGCEGWKVNIPAGYYNFPPWY